MMRFVGRRDEAGQPRMRFIGVGGIVVVFFVLECNAMSLYVAGCEDLVGNDCLMRTEGDVGTVDKRLS